MKEFMNALQVNGVSFTSTPEGLTIVDNPVYREFKDAIPQWAAVNGVTFSTIYK